MPPRSNREKSPDYALYEKMRRRSPRASRYWMIGDRLYHAGLLLTMISIPAIFFAWLQFGIPGALAVIIVVGILNLLVENPIYSFLAARKFEMPALIVIISVIFWGWLLGLVGMLFSIPFTLLLLLLFELMPELRWINVTLGVHHLFEDPKPGEPPSDPGSVP